MSDANELIIERPQLRSDSHASSFSTSSSLSDKGTSNQYQQRGTYGTRNFWQMFAHIHQYTTTITSTAIRKYVQILANVKTFTTRDIPLDQQTDNSYEPEDEPSNSLMRLNDDCLRNVFNYSDEEDLCRLADVCTRMRPIAEQVFGRRYKEKEFKHSKCDDSLRVLCKFGHLIKSLNVGGRMQLCSPRAMVKYCTSLTALSLIATKIKCGVMKPLFERLKRLDIDYCDFVGNASTLFKNCSKLENLRIQNYENVNFDFIAKEFPNLVEIELFPCNRHNFNSIRKFLTLNPQLQRMKSKVGDVRYISAIAELARHLEHLEIDCFRVKSPLRIEDLLPFSRLTKLKKLALSGWDSDTLTITPLMEAFLRANVALEHLDLELCDVNSNDIKTIVELKTLKTLKLFRIDCDLVSLATELPLLTELCIACKCLYRSTSVTVFRDIVRAGKHLDRIFLCFNQNFKIDLIDYEELLEATSNRISKNKLIIQIGVAKIRSTVDVPREILEKNKHQLEIIT